MPHQVSNVRTLFDYHRHEAGRLSSGIVLPIEALVVVDSRRAMRRPAQSPQQTPSGQRLVFASTGCSESVEMAKGAAFCTRYVSPQ